MYGSAGCHDMRYRPTVQTLGLLTYCFDQRIRGFGDYAQYKLTFYLLTYLLTHWRLFSLPHISYGQTRV